MMSPVVDVPKPNPPRTKGRMPLVIFDASRFGINEVAKVPVVIWDASRLGMDEEERTGIRAAANTPLVI